MKRTVLLAASLLTLSAASTAWAQMNMNLFNEKPAGSDAPASAAPVATSSAVTPAATAPATVTATTTAAVAPPATPAAVVPVAAAANATAACPAGKSNPATDQATRPDLPASLQKLYNLRLSSFTAADLDCDGFLNAGEIKAMIDRKFAAADTNGDGSISTEEAQGIISDFDEGAATTPGIIAGPRETTLKHRLSAMDADQNGTITKTEFETYFQARYQKLDRNGDGKLDITEYQTDDEDNRRQRNN